jgi:methionine-rich copper-binding protein CopC
MSAAFPKSDTIHVCGCFFLSQSETLRYTLERHPVNIAHVEGGISVHFLRGSLTILLFAALAASPAFAAHSHHSTSRSRSHSLHKAAPKSHRLHGQQAIEPARVAEIQQALIREHYLSSEANGKWDSTTEAAMQKYQADHGWQTKLMPDSRALKTLGLGPDYSTAINAKDSSFADPPSVRTIPVPQSEGFASAAGVSR